jgi:dTDP-4-dehydrorhamnose reductase
VKILLIGANGQLGTDLRKTNPSHEVIGLTRADGDIANGTRVRELLRQHAPEVVINTAAYHRVDDCEDEPEKAFHGNIVGPRALAEACAEIGARMVHYSTDYVFDGKKKLPYRESDRPGPLSVYGVSKLGGEYLVTAASDAHIVIRTASLFGTAGSSGKGGNFVETMIQKAAAEKSVSVVDDIIMSPTYTLDLAATTWKLLEKDVPGGLYHVANGGTCSWFEFTRKIFSLLGINTPLIPIRAADTGRKARRPAYSALGSERFPDLGIPPPRVWQEALKSYLIEKGHLQAVDAK